MADTAAMIATDQFIEDINHELGDQVWTYVHAAVRRLFESGRLTDWDRNGHLYLAGVTIEQDGTVRLSLALDIKPEQLDG